MGFFFLFVPPRSFGRSSPNLEGRWRADPDISLRVSFFEISRSSRSKVKFMLFFFSVCSPTSPRYLGRSSPNLVGRWRAAPDISSRGSFLKVKVIEVKGQISVSVSVKMRFSIINTLSVIKTSLIIPKSYH